MVPLLNVKFVTDDPSTPLRPMFWRFMLVNDGLRVLASKIPVPVVL